MEQIIIHPTDTSQWHALINEAQVKNNIILEVDTESYLVFLLMRYTSQADLEQSSLALDFLESKKSSGSKQIELLRSVGDKSLIISGLFPGLIKRKPINITYYIDMGQSSYMTLSESHDVDSKLYYQLSQQFVKLQTILSSISNAQL